MSDREYIKNDDGSQAKSSEGNPLFYSTEDGDSPNDQKVYEDKGFGGGTTKTDAKYNPETGKFKE